MGMLTFSATPAKPEHTWPAAAVSAYVCTAPGNKATTGKRDVSHQCGANTAIAEC